MTVQQALKLLRDVGLIVSWVGSGVHVPGRADQATGLRPLIEQAIEKTRVTIDFAGLTGETLLGALEEPIERIRRGRLTPESVTIRLLPDMSPADRRTSRAGSKAGDDPAVRDWVADIARRSARDIMEAVRELAELVPVQKVHVEARVIPLPMMFKMCLLNEEEEAFFGFYPVV
ncbi:hypothetical protein BWI15_35165 [Kribbella sp. ALI-6-A]|uniref:hypothetical protein n=1 Tax=Kribbella sp. ALI-6-A TaxID=1933817 RepID=UPI00097BFDD5|nr:hypothetical protein [Kribbella sp. ALI-6-A]ONI68261.1 hypothetical protein BWI15_35165 [Kribbella sp. ALI-6-A]